MCVTFTPSVAVHAPLHPSVISPMSLIYKEYNRVERGQPCLLDTTIRTHTCSYAAIRKNICIFVTHILNNRQQRGRHAGTLEMLPKLSSRDSGHCGCTKSNSYTMKKVLHADMQLSKRSNVCWSAHILSVMDGLTQSFIFKQKLQNCELSISAVLS